MLKSLPVNGELACLAWCYFSSHYYVLAGQWQVENATLVVYPVEGDSTDAMAVFDLESGILLSLFSFRPPHQMAV